MAKLNKTTFSFGGAQISVTKSTELAAVRYNKNAAPKGRAAKNVENDLESFKIVRAPSGIDKKLDNLRRLPQVAAGTHVYHLGDNLDAPFVPTGQIYIEFSVDAGSTAIRTLLETLHLRIIELQSESIYLVAVTSESMNPVKSCVFLQKQKIVQVAEPEFATYPKTNDFLMPMGAFSKSQWHHKNVGEAIPIIDIENAVFGKSHFKKGADAKISDAWTFLQDCGSPNIRVAVIDTGFDIDHISLKGNGGKIKFPFNAAENSTDVSPVVFDSSTGEARIAAHGTSCASVAVGVIDDEGVFGVAPKCQLTPIKLDILSDTAIIRAFQHCLNNNIDVISCSLGFPSAVPLSTQVANFLKKVATEGRGGRGIPMFFAAGNGNPKPNSPNPPRLISDFAAHPSGICIVASNSLDERSTYSFFGKNAWISAPTNGDPGVGITTATADWDGSQIIHNYTSGFGGTSSAAPLSAGVCALMLSANPNLTVSQIKDILKNTAEKIGSASEYDATGHSTFRGFGRINALKAVQMSAPTSAPAPVASRLKGRVKSKFLNVRSSPGTNFPKVGELATGAIVELLEKQDSWYRIGDNQWIKSDFIDLILPPKQGKVIAADALNVRAGADVSFAKVGTIKPNTIVTIFETATNGWLRIGEKQWVSGRFVKVI
jgi:uncharacterized protein YraI